MKIALFVLVAGSFAAFAVIFLGLSALGWLFRSIKSLVNR